jgi:drug/metabolite transporter (DMT)-like permease
LEGFRSLEERCGVPLAALAAPRAAERITFADAQVQPRTVLTSPEWSGIDEHGRRYSPFTTLVFGLGFAAVFWLLVLVPARVVGVFVDTRTALAVLFVAVVSTIIPFSAFLAALSYIAPTNATVTSTAEPVIAGIGAFFLFGEALTPLQLLGGLLVVAAIAVVQRPERNPAPILPPQD